MNEILKKNQSQKSWKNENESLIFVLFIRTYETNGIIPKQRNKKYNVVGKLNGIFRENGDFFTQNISKRR